MQFLTNTNLDVMGKRRIAAALSLTLIFAGVVSLLIKGGPALSIDFRGGTTVELRIDPAVPIGQLRGILEKAKVPEQGVQGFGDSQEVLIALPAQTQEGLEDSTPTVAKIVQDALPDHTVELRRVETVGPKIGGELKKAALNAIFVSLFCIILYVTFRFQFQFALAAVLALVHDVLVTLGIFSLMDKEISLTILAAFLTIIGYSLNDTIIVFDRIRENMGMRRKESYESILNKSINETLSRTVITSLTTFFVAFILYLLGGPVIHDFAFALTIGVVVGTYSSIYVASPLLIIWYNWRSRDHKRGAPATKRSGQKATA